MYRQHFGLRDKPFRVVPSPRFLFASETHDESRARILYGIRESRGFVVVTGGIGLGKTTVLLAVLDQLESTVRSALVFNPVENFSQLLRMICYEFGVAVEGHDEIVLMQKLNLFLVDRHAAGESCVLLIDEAQNLSVEVLEKVRTLSNLQTENESLLQIVLVGQPELLEHLADPRLVQLRQRVGVWHEILPLSAEETRSYIWHRLRLAGSAIPERLLDDRVCLRVLTRTGGVPRLVNQLCDTALVIAYGQDSETVQPRHVDEAAIELRLDEGQEYQASAASAASTLHRFPRRRTIAVAGVALAVVTAVALWGEDLWSRLDNEGDRGTIFSGVPSSGERADAEVDMGAGSQATPIENALHGTTTDPDGVVSTTRDAAARVALQETQGQVERWIQSGRTVYGIHLASFRTPENAQLFVDELVTRHPDWSNPMYMDSSGGDTTWYRVIAGGFRERSDARTAIVAWKEERGVAYAQPTRLNSEAIFLAPAVDANTGRGETGAKR